MHLSAFFTTFRTTAMALIALFAVASYSYSAFVAGDEGHAALASSAFIFATTLIGVYIVAGGVLAQSFRAHLRRVADELPLIATPLDLNVVGTALAALLIIAGALLHLDIGKIASLVIEASPAGSRAVSWRSRPRSCGKPMRATGATAWC